MSVVQGIPAYMLGKNVVVTITPLIPDALGAFTDDTVVGTQYMNGFINGDDMDVNILTTNISPTNAFYSNPVPYEQATRFSINEIATAWPVVASGANASGWGHGNILMACAYQSLYARLNIYFYENDLSTEIYKWEGTVLMVDLRRTSPKQENNWMATFQTVLIWNTADSTYISNPTATIP